MIKLKIEQIFLKMKLLLIIDILKKQRIKKLSNIFNLILPIGMFFGGLILISSSTFIKILHSYGFTYETQAVIIRPLAILLIPLIVFIVYFLIRPKIETFRMIFPTHHLLGFADQLHHFCPRGRLQLRDRTKMVIRNNHQMPTGIRVKIQHHKSTLTAENNQIGESSAWRIA